MSTKINAKNLYYIFKQGIVNSSIKSGITQKMISTKYLINLKYKTEIKI